MKITYAYYLFILVFFSCNNPLSKSYEPKTFESDLQDIKVNTSTSDEDIRSLTHYILLAQLHGQRLEGKSYEDLLGTVNAAKKTLQDQSNSEKDHQSDLRRRFQSFLRAELLTKTFISIRKRDHLIYTVTFHNLTGNNIRTITGYFSLQDLMGNEIKKLDIVMNEVLPAMSSATKTYDFDYDLSNESDQIMRFKEIINMHVDWNPGKIIFTNGTLLN